MRVLVIAHGHPDIYPGGSEIVARALAQALRGLPGTDSRFLVVLPGAEEVHGGTGFSSYDGDPNEPLFTAGGFDEFSLGQQSIAHLTHPFAAFLEAYRPDVVHFQHIINIGVEALRVVHTVLPRAIIVYTLHEFTPICNHQGKMLRTDGSLCDKAGPRRCNGCFPQTAPREFFLRERYLKAHFEVVDGFIGPSRFLLSRYAEWGLDERKLRFIENGHPLAACSRDAVAAHANHVPSFAFFGQINPFKGIFVLLDAIEILLNRGVSRFHVRVHGTVLRQSDAFKQQYDDAVQRIRSHPAYGGQLWILGPYGLSETLDRVRDADAVIVPSVWWENSPLVIQEAFIAGRPVICSDIGGMAEKVADGVNGLHFRARDPIALAETLRRCIEEPLLLPGLNQYPPVPTAEESAVVHLEYYEELAARRGDPRSPVQAVRV